VASWIWSDADGGMRVGGIEGDGLDQRQGRHDILLGKQLLVRVLGGRMCVPVLVRLRQFCKECGSVRTARGQSPA
jgi:hypothetical protein